MRNLLDCHTHTAEWSDGSQSIEQVLQRAGEEGIRVGLSDHAGSEDYLNSNDKLVAYADFLGQYPVARGLEMDLGKGFLLTPEARSRFDYMIGSVHGMVVEGVRLSFSHLLKFLKGEMPGYNPLEQIKDLGCFFKTHLGLLRKEMTAQKYDILGHCSMLPTLALGKPEEIFPEWWEDELIGLLLSQGTAMEISNRWLTPYGRLLKKALDAGLKFSLGSDGHEPKKTCVLEYPKEMVNRFRIPEDRIFDISRKLEAA